MFTLGQISGHFRPLLAAITALVLVSFINETAHSQSITEWQELPIYGDTVSDMVFASDSHKTVFAAGGGVFRSDDGGQTWKDITGDLPKRQAHRIAVHPTDSQQMFVSTRETLFKSVDGGASWTVAFDGVEVNSIAFDPQQPSSIYIGTDAEEDSSGACLPQPRRWKKLAIHLDLFK